MDVRYSYTFATGLTIEFGQKEREEIDKLLAIEIYKHEEECGGKVVWTRSNIGMPYRIAISKYFKHNDQY